jgi:hypothetical protein
MISVGLKLRFNVGNPLYENDRFDDQKALSEMPVISQREGRKQLPPFR